jgi:hypothetical protein
MKRLILSLILIAILLPSTGAQAGPPKTVREFMAACQVDNMNGGFCFGTIFGVQRLMTIIGVMPDVLPKDKQAFGMCPTGAVSIGQIEQAFQNWATKNPREWQDEGIRGIMLAIRETWPCN